MDTNTPDSATGGTDLTDPFVTAEYRFHPLAEAAGIGVLVCAVILLTTFFIYHHAVNAQRGEIQQGLLRTAAVLSTFVDCDQHPLFVSPEQEASDAYREAIAPFQRALRADGTIANVYTAVLKDGKVYLVLDPMPAGDADGDGVDDKGHIMQEYSEATPEILRALTDQTVVTTGEPYRDRWGAFVSGYVPLYDSRNSFVGILGVDIRADDYITRLAPIRRATLRAMVAGFFIAFLVSAMVWFLRNFSKVINRSRLRIHAEYLRLRNAR